MIEFVRVKDYWVSESPLSFELRKPVENVEVFGNLLKKYFEIKGFPFPIKEYFLLLTDKKARNFKTYWERGYLIIRLKKRSLLSRLNPTYNEIKSEETLVVEFLHNSKDFICYQGKEGMYKYVWKLSLKEIEAFSSLLEKFAKADDIYKLLLRCAKTENILNREKS